MLKMTGKCALCDTNNSKLCVKGSCEGQAFSLLFLPQLLQQLFLLIAVLGFCVRSHMPTISPGKHTIVVTGVMWR